MSVDVLTRSWLGSVDRSNFKNRHSYASQSCVSLWIILSPYVIEMTLLVKLIYRGNRGRRSPSMYEYR